MPYPLEFCMNHATPEQKGFIPAILRPDKAAAYLGISKNTIYRWLRENPSFPRLIKIGQRSSGWRVADLDAWLDCQAQKSREAMK